MTLSSGIHSQEMTAFADRLSAWHDAMVAHERRLRAGSTSDACDEECPHADARALWAEAVATFGPRAEELTFLRSRGQRGPGLSPHPHEPLAVEIEPLVRAGRSATRSTATLQVHQGG